MADRIPAFTVLVSSGTSTANPQTFDLPFTDGIVDMVQIVVPPGPSGLLGFQLLYGGVVFLPDDDSTYFVADGENIAWPIHNAPTGSKWQLRAYNGDIYDHTLYVRFLVTELAAPTRPAVMLVPIN